MHIISIICILISVSNIWSSFQSAEYTRNIFDNENNYNDENDDNDNDDCDDENINIDCNNDNDYNENNYDYNDILITN